MKLIILVTLCLILALCTANNIGSTKLGASSCPWYYLAGSKSHSYGWSVNGSIIELSSIVAMKYLNDCAYVIPSWKLWNSIPRHNLIMNDPLMKFVHVQQWSGLPADVFMIVNGSKWPIMGGMNDTLSMGVKQEMIAESTAEYVNTLPTAEWFFPG